MPFENFTQKTLPIIVSVYILIAQSVSNLLFITAVLVFENKQKMKQFKDKEFYDCCLLQEVFKLYSLGADCLNDFFLLLLFLHFLQNICSKLSCQL